MSSFFILLIVSNTKSTCSRSTSPRSTIVFFLPFYATIFTTLSLHACKPCRAHPGRSPDWPETRFPRLQRVSFCLSFSLQVTRQQGVVCRQLPSSRGEKKKKSKHSAIRGELFGSNQNRRQCFFLLLLFFPPSLPVTLSHRSANR